MDSMIIPAGHEYQLLADNLLRFPVSASTREVFLPTLQPYLHRTNPSQVVGHYVTRITGPLGNSTGVEESRALQRTSQSQSIASPLRSWLVLSGALVTYQSIL